MRLYGNLDWRGEWDFWGGWGAGTAVGGVRWGNMWHKNPYSAVFVRMIWESGNSDKKWEDKYILEEDE